MGKPTNMSNPVADRMMHGSVGIASFHLKSCYESHTHFITVIPIQKV